MRTSAGNYYSYSPLSKKYSIHEFANAARARKQRNYAGAACLYTLAS